MRLLFLGFVAFIFVLGMLFVSFFHAGMNWLDHGYGLHPALAFPLAMLCIGVAVASALTVMWEDAEAEESALY